MKSKMIQAPYLKSGDQIYILSTARKISKEELQPAIQEFESWGLKVVLGESIEAEENQLAGSDEVRLKDINKAIHDDQVKAIICARGGYGTVRIVDGIDWEQLKSHPKWICGYSDVTTIHSTANRQGIQTIHSTMPVNFSSNTSESLQTLKSALFGEEVYYSSFPFDVHRSGRMEGELVGGNLSILYSLLGSPSCIHTSGKVLFIEDLD